MPSHHMVFSAQIAGPPQFIFDLIADMPNYNRWLPGSQAFGATTQVTPYPVRLGSTYLDSGSLGQRPGSVTEYDPPARIAFHHTMLVKPLAANLDIHIHYIFALTNQGTNVSRTLDFTLRMPFLLRWATPFILRGLRKENLRILAELKCYVESQGPASHS